VLLILALLFPVQDAEFGEILKRFEADEPAVRESASKDLDAFVRKLGPKAADYLKLKLADAQGEVRGRINQQLGFLDRVDKARKLLQPLEALDLPDLSKARLVLYNSGRLGWSNDTQYFQCYVGFLTAETPEQVRLLSLVLETGVYERKFEPPKNWEELKTTIPKGAPLPGAWVEIDFKEACERFCSAERPPWKFYEHNLGPASGWSLEAATMAAWALQRGQERAAFELLEAAEEAVRRDRGGEKRSYAEILLELVCSHLRVAAIDSADPRPQILKRWQTIQKLHPTYKEREAARMIPLYERLIAEDAAWKEPGPEDAGRKNTAAYWIHHLRDVAARQMSDPGSCDIVHDWTNDGKDKPYPPRELIKMGWDALPALIERLDDPLPTRSVGWHRSFNIDSYYLLRIGDCCQQIFTAITGVSIYEERTTSSAMVKDGDAPASKDKARKWWDENGKNGAEAYYVSALSKPERAGFAALKLLERDRAKHFPRLIELLEKGSPDLRSAILEPLGPCLEKQHEKLLDAVLASLQPGATVAAARIYWKQFGSDRGALELIERLKAVPAEDKDSSLSWVAFHVIPSIRTERTALGLIDLMDSRNLRVRMEALVTGRSFPYPAVAKALVGHLEDKTLTGWSSSYPIRFCDNAALGLIGMAGFEEKIAYKGSGEERDRILEELKAWWRKEGGTFDWAARRKALKD
jgi:hypothetical protein